MEIKELIQFIFKKHSRNVYKFFYFKTINKEVSEDLTSEVFLTFVKKIQTDNKNIDNYENYLFGIVKLKFLEFLKNKYKTLEVSSIVLEDFDLYFQETISQTEKDLTEMVKSYLDKLPEKQGVVLRLRFIEKMPLSEICNFLKKDMNYVKTTQKRGLRNLKNLIECTPPTT